MKSFLKKLSNFRVIAIILTSITLLLAIIFTIVSYEPSINTKVPYGSINGDYAVNGDTKLTNTQLYDLLRNNGYQTLSNEIKEIILKDYIAKIDLNDADQLEYVSDMINNAVFGKTEIDEINGMTASEISVAKQKFIDSLFTFGIVITESDIVITDEKVTYPQKVYDNYNIELATYILGKEDLTKSVNEEKTLDSDDNEIDNPDYISLEDVEAYYNETYRNAQDFKAIIVGFNTAKEAKDAIAAGAPTTEAAFTTLYNTQYSFNTAPDFTVNSEILADYNAAVGSYIANVETDETTNIFYTTKPKELGEKWYLIYVERDETLFEDSWEKVNDGLTDEQIIASALYTEVKEEIFDSKLTDAYSESVLKEKITDLIEEEKITIYDPVFAISFSQIYDTYTNLKASNDSIVASVDGTDIKAVDLFETLKAIFGTTIATDFFVNAAIANSDFAGKLTDEEISAAKDELDKELESYKTNAYYANGISKQFSKSQFLKLKYGYSSEKDVLKYYFYPNKAKAYLTSDYDDTFFKLLEETGKNYYDNYYSLDIEHVLLSVDYDLDGNLDNPDEFMNKLSDADKTKFLETIRTIYSYINAEAEFLNIGVSEALDHIASTTFMANGEINFVTDTTAAEEFRTNNGLAAGSALYANWGEVKTSSGINFNISIKVEKLGDIDPTTGSNYVEAFTNQTIKLYNDLKTEAMYETFEDLDYVEADYDTQEKIDKIVKTSEYIDEFKDVFDDLLSKENIENITLTTDFEDICKSVFGFHMLLAVDGNVQKSAYFTYDDDYKLDSEDENRAYEKIEITLNDKTETINAYSDTNYASLNQLKIYIAEKDTDEGVESLKTNTTTIIDSVYQTFKARYENDAFVKLLAIKELSINVTYTNADDSTHQAEILEILKRNIDEYKTLENTNYENWWNIFNS